jgi:DNA-binding beta-propeller fold protein YncE
MRATTKRVVTAIGLLLASRVGAEALEDGDVLLDHFGGKIQQIRHGSIVDTFTSATSSWAGVAATRDGIVATVHRTPSTGLSLFPAGGGPVAEPAVSGVALPTDLDVFPDGTFAILDTNGNAVKLVSPAGASLGTLTSPTVQSPFGLAVGRRQTVWVASRDTQHVDHLARDGTSLGGFDIDFDPGEIVVDPADGTLWIAGATTGAIAHRDPYGADLGSVATGITASQQVPFNGLAITRSGDLLAVDRAGSQLLAFDRSGASEGALELVAPDSPFRIVVVPEPASRGAAVAALATSLVLSRRR